MGGPVYMAALLASVFLGLLPPSQAAKFWHISDLHLDFNYDVNGDVNSFCHKNASVPSKVPLSDAGNYSCDAPLLLVKSILKAMHNKEPNPDFIIWTGDNGPHYSVNYTYITNVTSLVFSEIHKLFGDNVTVIPALGNHDAYPADVYVDAKDHKNSNSSDQTQYQQYWEEGGFGKHIDGPENKKSFLRCGYYTKKLKIKEEELKMVVLNTNIYYNNPNVSDVLDPCDQLAWLKKTLTEASDTEKVYLMAHVPPGTFEINPNTSFFNSPPQYAAHIEKTYVTTVSDPILSKKIQAHFYGHAHTDSFRLFLDRAISEEVRGVGFLGSSGTPVVWGKDGVLGVNPGMRLFELYDDGTLKDYQQFGLDLENLDNSRNNEVEKTEVDAQKRSKREDQPSTSSTTASAAVPVAPGSLAAVPTASGSPASVAPGSTASVATGSTAPALPDAPAPVANVSVPTTVAINASTAPVTVSKAVPIKPETSRDISKNPTILGHQGENPTPELSSNSSMAVPSSISSTAVPSSNSSIAVPSSNSSIAVPSSSSTSTVDASSNAPAVKVAPAEASSPPTAEKTVTSALEDTKRVDELASMFKLIYNATDAFKVNNISAVEMGKAYNSMVNHTAVFDSYYLHNTVNHINNTCDQVCFRGHMCTIKHAVTEEFQHCMKNTDESLMVTVPGPTPSSSASTPSSTASTVASSAAPSPATLPAVTNVPLIPLTTPIPEIDAPTTNATSASTPSIEPVANKDTDQPDIVIIKPSGGSTSSKVAGIFLGVSGALILALAIGLIARRYARRRRRDQEFLLTDSVFRYDGYSQLDEVDPFQI